MAKRYSDRLIQEANEWYCRFYDAPTATSMSWMVRNATGNIMSDKEAARFIAMEFAFRFPRRCGEIRADEKLPKGNRKS